MTNLHHWLTALLIAMAGLVIGAGPSTNPSTRPTGVTGYKVIRLPDNGGAADGDHLATGAGTAPFGLPGARRENSPKPRREELALVRLVATQQYDAGLLSMVVDDAFLKLTFDQQKLWDAAMQHGARGVKAVNEKYAAEKPSIDRNWAAVRAAHGSLDLESIERMLQEHKAYFVESAKAMHDFRAGMFAVLTADQRRKWDRAAVEADLLARAPGNKPPEHRENEFDLLCGHAVRQIEEMAEPRDAMQIDHILDQVWRDFEQAGDSKPLHP